MERGEYVLFEIEDKASRLDDSALPVGVMTAGGFFKRATPIQKSVSIRQYGLLIPRDRTLRLRVETRTPIRDRRGQSLQTLVDLEPLLERTPGLPTRLRLFLE
jgi:hypothetical protein